MRLTLALYTLVFAARAFGVELIRPSAPPVQLTFTFAAPAMIAPLSAAAPMPLAAPLGSAPTLAPIAAISAAPTPAAVAAPALAAAPPAAPAVITLLPRSAPATSADEDGDDGRSQLRQLARDDVGTSRAFDSPRRATKMDYVEFGRQLARRSGLDLNPFNQADAKRRILAASGYTHLYGAGGVRIPIADASDVRVGNAFLRVKRTFDRRP